MDLSVVISMLMRLPQAHMASVKRDFGRAGLDLESFVSTMMRNLSKSRQGIRSKEDVQREGIDVICDLTDFFSQVDVDGNKVIKWEEFLGYIVEQGAALRRDSHFEDSYVLRQDYDLVFNAQKETIHQIHWVPSHGRLFACMGQKIKVFNLHTHEGPKSRLSCELELSARGSLDYVGASDLCYIEEDDLLVVLQMNLCMSFFKFITRGAVTNEHVWRAGDVVLSHQPYRVVWSQAHRLLFTAGNDNTIKAWKLKVLEGGNHKILHYHTLKEHKDVVTDMALVNDRDNKQLLVSAGMDRKVIFWDLEGHRVLKILSGHNGGVSCLAYDGESQVFSGGFDCEILVWEVNGNSHIPTYKLSGHKFPIVRLAMATGHGRMVSLDRQGKFCWWDIRKAVALDNKERCIQQFMCKEHSHTIEVAHSPLGSKKRWSVNGLSIVVAGDRIHTYDCIDARPNDMQPSLVAFNRESLTVLTTHGSNVKVWDATAGRFLKEYVKLTQGDISGLAFDKGRRKMLLSSQGGEILLCNYFNGKALRHFPSQRAEVLNMTYLEQAHLILISTADRAIRVLDERAVKPSDCLLRSVEAAHQLDLVAMTYDPDLSLVATASADGTIKFWDFQFFTLEGIYQAKSPLAAEISCIAFYPSYPLLLAGDSSGGVTVVPVRPWLPVVHQRYHPLLRMVCSGGSAPVLRREPHNEDPAKSDVAVAVVVITVTDILMPPTPAPPSRENPEGDQQSEEPPCQEQWRRLVYVCNEIGIVRAYDIQPLLDSLEVKPLADSDIAWKRSNYNARRKISRNGLAMRVSGTRDVSEGDDNPAQPSVADICPPAPSSSMVKLVYSWVAHDDTILAVEALRDPCTILTSSSDLSVKLWSPSGAILGVLTWGRQLDLSVKRCWNFPFDFEARQQARKSKAKDLLEAVVSMEATRRIKPARPESPPLLPKLTVSPTTTMRKTSLLPMAGMTTASGCIEAALATSVLGRGGRASGLIGCEKEKKGGQALSPPRPAPRPSQFQRAEEARKILDQLHPERTSACDSTGQLRDSTLRGFQEPPKGTSLRQGKRKRKKQQQCNNDSNIINNTNDNNHHPNPNKPRKRRGRRASLGSAGGEEGDGVYRSLQAVDSVIARLQFEEKKVEDRRKQADEEEAMGHLNRRRDSALLDEAKYGLLRTTYADRHRVLYPHFQAEKDKAEAESDIQKAVTTLRSLSSLPCDPIRIMKSPSPTPARSQAVDNEKKPVKIPEKKPEEKPQPQPQPRPRSSITGPPLFPKQAEIAAAVHDVDAVVEVEKETIKKEQQRKEARRSVQLISAPINPELLQTLCRPTQASIQMQSRAMLQKEKDEVARAGRHKRIQKRVRSTRKFGPYLRDDLLAYYDAFQLVDSKGSGKASLQDLMGTEFAEANAEYRYPLENCLFGSEDGATKVLTLEQGLRVIFPLLHSESRKEVFVLYDMYKAHLDRHRSKTDLVGEEKLRQLKSLFEMYDTNGNGAVEVRELMAGIRNDDDKLGIGASLEKLMIGASKTGETLLRFDEFVSMAHDLELL